MRALLLILALVSQTPNNPRITLKYDRFSDTTSLVLTQWVDALSGIVDLGGGSYAVKPGAKSEDVVYLHVVAVSVGKALDRNARLALAFSSRSGNWIYLKQTNTLRMIVNDTERLDFGVMDRTHSDVTSRGVTEQIAVKLALPTIEKLAKAEKIEVQLGGEEFELGRKQIDDLKDFVSYFPKATGN